VLGTSYMIFLSYTHCTIALFVFVVIVQNNRKIAQLKERG